MDLADATLVALAEEKGQRKSSRSIRTFTCIGFADGRDLRLFRPTELSEGDRRNFTVR
jgi:hypothetical protein